MNAARISSCCLTLLLFALILTAAPAFGYRFTEDFTTREFCNQAATTAEWDTLAGEVRLPEFTPGWAGDYDTPGSPAGVAVSGDLAVVCDYGLGQMIDVCEPPGPRGRFGLGCLLQGKDAMTVSGCSVMEERL